MQCRAIPLPFWLLAAGIAAASASVGAQGSLAGPEGRAGPVLLERPTIVSAPSLAPLPGQSRDGAFPAAGTLPAFLLVGATDDNRGLEMRPIDPVSVADLPGHAPLSLGHHYTHAVSPDGRTLAALVGLSGLPLQQDTELRLFDLVSWKEMGRVPVREFGLALTFSPDGQRLYWLEPTARHRDHGMPRDYVLFRFDVSSQRLETVARFPTSFMPRELRLLDGGRRAAVYGLPTATDSVAAGPPRVLSVDLTTGKIVSEAQLDGVTDGRIRLPSGSNVFDLGQHRAGLAWDPEHSRLYVVHPDEDRVTVVDLARGAVIQQAEFGPKPTLADRFWRWLTPVASAKTMPPGTHRRAILSRDGSRLHVGALRFELVKLPSGFVRDRAVPLGLHVIATGDFRELAHLDTWASTVALSPDEKWLVLSGTLQDIVGGQEQSLSRLSIVDNAGFEEVVRFPDTASYLQMHGFSSDSRYVYLSYSLRRGERLTTVFQVMDLTSQQVVVEREIPGHFGALVTGLDAPHDP